MSDSTRSFEMSLQQKRLWRLIQSDGPAAYPAWCAVEIDGPLNGPLLQSALAQLAGRHEILRTHFCPRPPSEYPIQVVVPRRLPEWRDVDLSGVEAPAQAAALETLLHQQALQGFDLEHDALLRAVLVTLAPTRAVLVITMPVLCADRRTLENLIRELAASYQACLTHRAGDVVETPVQYAQFSGWQDEFLASEEALPGLSYWRSRQTPHWPALTLGDERRIADALRFTPQRLPVSVSPQALERLHHLAESDPASCAAFLLAGWQILLWRLSAQPEIEIIGEVDGRPVEELQSALGPYAKPAPLRFHLEDGLRFTEVWRKTRRVLEDSVDRQEFLSEAAFSMSDRPDRGRSSSGFEFIMRPAPCSLQGVSFKVSQAVVYSHPCKIKMVGIRHPDRVQVELHYDACFFIEADIQRLAARLSVLLDSALAGPETAVERLTILGLSERQQLVFEWNDTTVAYQPFRCVHQMIEAQAHATPEQLAVSDAMTQLTYDQLNARANQLAHYLKRLGVGPEARVGICLERSVDMIVAILGILKAGSAYVPVEPTYPVERITFMLEDARPLVLITRQDHLTVLPALAGEAGPRVLCLDRDWDAVAGFSDQDPVSDAQPANLAYVLYTSGSTGKPKGVMISHEAIRNRLLWMQAAYPLTGADRVLQKTPFTFDVSVWEFFWPLMVGARLVFAIPEGHKDPSYLVSAIRASGITVIHFVPSMLYYFLEAPDVEACQSLRRVFCSGEELTVGLQERFFRRCAATLHNLYGPTEAAVDVSYWDCTAGHPAHCVPIGYPIANIQLHVLDRWMQPAPIGVPGELYIGGIGLARGYLHQPALTARQFVPDPFGRQAGSRLYRTGDLARYRPDGAIEFLGRADRQVKIRGFRVELGEIEAAMGRHPAVNAGVAVIREDRPGDRRLVAYLVFAEAQQPALNDLRSFLRRHLPDYMVPTNFVMLPQLPLTPNGKLDMRALPAPDAGRPELESAYTAPGTEMERAIAAIWRNILGLEHVGIDDNFFDLGGYSFLMFQVHEQLKTVVQRDLPLLDLFQYPTIRALARSLGQGDDRTARLEKDRDRALARATSIEALSQLQPKRKARKGE